MGIKEAYQQKMNAQLQEWQQKIDLLKSQADKAEAEQKIKYYEQIESLRAKQVAVHEKMDELRTAGEGAWEDVKAGVELAWRDLEDAYERAVSKFK